MSAQGARMIDDTRHVAAAQNRARHGAPGHEATLPPTPVENATQDILSFRVPDGCRASTTWMHTVARPRTMRPSRPDSLHAPTKCVRELGRARQTGLMVLAMIRQPSATRARDNRSARWLDCGCTPTLAVRTEQPSRTMVASILGRSATAAHGLTSVQMGGAIAASRGSCSCR